MATDSSKWDIGMFLQLCKSDKFNPKEITFKNADDMLGAITQVVRVVCSSGFIWFYLHSSGFICVHLKQKFESQPLGIRNLKLWSRDPVALMADMLEDPDYCDSMDWSGKPPGPHGVYNTVTSGDWYREVQVSCGFVWFHLLSSGFLYIHVNSLIQ